jgi:hypothetical protein
MMQNGLQRRIASIALQTKSITAHLCHLWTWLHVSGPERRFAW